MNLPETIQQPASSIVDGLHSIPDAVGGLDLADLADDVTTAVANVAEAAAVTGGRTAWRAARSAARYRRGVGLTAVVALAAGAMLYKRRSEQKSSPSAADG